MNEIGNVLKQLFNWLCFLDFPTEPGLLLFTILSGCFPYRGATDKELYSKITRADYKLPSEVYNSLSGAAIDLISSLFNTNADSRPTAKQILNHPWLHGVSLPQLAPCKDLVVAEMVSAPPQQRH